jgi:hypothetical protein
LFVRYITDIYGSRIAFGSVAIRELIVAVLDIPVLCQPSIDGVVGQVVNLSLDRMPSCPTHQTNIDRVLATFCVSIHCRRRRAHPR